MRCDMGCVEKTDPTSLGYSPERKKNGYHLESVKDNGQWVFQIDTKIMGPCMSYANRNYDINICSVGGWIDWDDEGITWEGGIE